MANIPSGSVTYVLTKQSMTDDSRRNNILTLTFGDGALTYPAGGVPILKASLGLPTQVDTFSIIDKGTSGYTFSYDLTNNKLIMMQAPVQTHTHDILFKNAQTASTTLSNVTLAASKLGANTGSDITITGGGTLGGVVTTTLAAAGLSEISTVAFAAQTIVVSCTGW